MKVLVVANETVGGQELIDAVEARKTDGEVEAFVVCPQNQPKHGYVIYDGSVREAAENRLKTTIAQLKIDGVTARGEVMDPDPFSATMDAIEEFHPDEIVVSTHPSTRSGWLRRGLVDRIRQESGLPVQHVEVDLDRDRRDVTNTLVVANQTVTGNPLTELLERKAAESPHRFTVICPQGDDEDNPAYERLAAEIKKLEAAGLEAVGQVVHPDPYTAIMNALQFYMVDEIVISTFKGERSGWLRNNLIGRVQASSAAPVEHIEVAESEIPEQASAPGQASA